MVDQVPAVAPPPDTAPFKVIFVLLAHIVKFGLTVRVGFGWIFITILSLTFEHKPELSIANKVNVNEVCKRSAGLKL